MEKIKVKFIKEHQHDGRTVKEGDVLELPKDLADFVIGAKKAVLAPADEKKK